MDNKKRRKIIIIAVIILVILGILFLILRMGKEPIVNQNTVSERPPVLKVPSAEFEYQPVTKPPMTSVEFTVVNLAKTYASRFGSWSTDNQGHNLEELLVLSTATMKNYLNSIQPEIASGFNGFTTKSLSAEILSLKPGEAEVMVGTQRIETDGSLKEKIYYQDIKVSMVKNGDEWLVDKANWQAIK